LAARDLPQNTGRDTSPAQLDQLTRGVLSSALAAMRSSLEFHSPPSLQVRSGTLAPALCDATARHDLGITRPQMKPLAGKLVNALFLAEDLVILPYQHADILVHTLIVLRTR